MLFPNEVLVHSLAHRTGQKSLFLAASLTAFLCALPLRVTAQESIRPSSTGAAAAEARHASTSNQTYNLKLGPVLLDASAGVGVEVNDNVNLSENHRESDVAFRVSLPLRAEWQATSKNAVHLNIGLGYTKYVKHSELDTNSVLLDPGTELSFDIYVGGYLRLNLHDRIDIVQNPIEENTPNHAGLFDRLKNAVGVTAVWDLNDVALVAGYDHFTYRSLDSQFSFLDHNEEQFFASASAHLSDALTVGLDGSFSLIDYREDFNNNGTTGSVGPLIEMMFSPFTRLRVSGGWQSMNFDGDGQSGDHSDYNGWYANATLSNQFNQYWSHALSIGHESRLGLEENFSEYYYARYIAAWRINTRTTASFDLFVEDANDSGNNPGSSEHSLRWGTTASVSRRLGSRFAVDLRYRFANKDSDLALRSYYQNTGTVTFSYDF
jgi:hypothetical protein